MSVEDKESRFRYLMQQQDLEISSLMQQQVKLDLQARQLAPDPIEPVIQKAKTDNEALLAKLNGAPNFKNVQEEYDFHQEYRASVDAHCDLYKRIKNNAFLGRENENEKLNTIAKTLQETISKYEDHYMTINKFSKTEDERRMNSSGFTAKKYNAEDEYLRNKRIVDRILSGKVLVNEIDNKAPVNGLSELLGVESWKSSTRNYASEKAVVLGNSMGFCMDEMLKKQEPHYIGIKAKINPSNPDHLLQHLNTLIVLLTILNITSGKENDILKKMFMTILDQNLMQATHKIEVSKLWSEHGPFSGVVAFSEQLGYDLGVKDGSLRLMAVIRQLYIDPAAKINLNSQPNL